MPIKKHERIADMHRLFGKNDRHICAKCSNLICGTIGCRRINKCLLYGLSHSVATDWAKRWYACGMFNKEPEKGFVPVIRRVTIVPKPVEQVEGQIDMSLDDLEGESTHENH